MASGYTIGVDLGGTKIAAVLCDPQGNMLSKVKTDTGAAGGERQVLQRIKDSITGVIGQAGVEKEDISGIGLCSPGPLSVSRGTVIYVATLGWRDVPIRRILEDEFHIPVFLENDCNAAAYGELMLGAGRGYRDMIYITVSTGIGSGIIAGGRIVHGRHDAAGEFGHICVEPGGRQCSCGNRGCLQAYASGTSIVQLADEAARLHPESMLSPCGPGALSCQAIADAARKGDPFASAVWALAGDRLGQGISILLQLFDTGIVVIGGGVTNAWDLFYAPMVRSVNEKVYQLIRDDMKIVKAQLGEDAGALGAILIARENQGQAPRGDFFLSKNITL